MFVSWSVFFPETQSNNQKKMDFDKPNFWFGWNRFWTIIWMGRFNSDVPTDKANPYWLLPTPIFLSSANRYGGFGNLLMATIGPLDQVPQTCWF